MRSRPAFRRNAASRIERLDDGGCALDRARHRSMVRRAGRALASGRLDRPLPRAGRGGASHRRPKRRARRIRARFAAGALAWCAGAATAVLAAWAVAGRRADACRAGPRRCCWAWRSSRLLAWRMLRDEVLAVEAALAGSLDAGRDRLAHLVSRDVHALNEAEVRESAIESLAENLNDSVVAPVFWFVLFGPAGRGALPLCQHRRCDVGLSRRAPWPCLGMGRQVGRACGRCALVGARAPHRIPAAPVLLAPPPGRAGVGAAIAAKPATPRPPTAAGPWLPWPSASAFGSASRVSTS